MRVLALCAVFCLLPVASAVTGPHLLWNDAQFDAMSGSVREPDPRADLVQWRMTEEPRDLLFQLITRGTPSAPVPQNANPGYSASVASELRVTTPTGEVSRLRVVLDDALQVTQDGVTRTDVRVVDPAPDRLTFRLPKAGFWAGRALGPLDMVGGAATWLNATGIAGPSTDRGPNTGVGSEFELDGGLNATTFTMTGDEDNHNAAGPSVDWHNGSWQAAWAYTGGTASRDAGIYWTSGAAAELVAPLSVGQPGRMHDRLRVALDASGPAILAQTTVDTGSCQWAAAVRSDETWNVTNPASDRADCSLGATGDILVTQHGLLAAVPTPTGFELRLRTESWETLAEFAGSSPRLADPRDPVVGWYEGPDESGSGRILMASMSGDWMPSEIAAGVPNDAGRVGLESPPRFDVAARPDGRIGWVYFANNAMTFRLGEQTESAPVSGNILDLEFDDMGNAHIASGFGTSGGLWYRTVYGHWRVEPAPIGRMVALGVDGDGRVAVASTAPNGGSALQITVADRSPFPPGFAPMGSNVTLGEIPDIAPPAASNNTTASPEPVPSGGKKSPLPAALVLAGLMVAARRRR